MGSTIQMWTLHMGPKIQMWTLHPGPKIQATMCSREGQEQRMGAGRSNTITGCIPFIWNFLFTIPVECLSLKDIDMIHPMQRLLD